MHAVVQHSDGAHESDDRLLLKENDDTIDMAPCALLQLSDDALEVVGFKISDALQPAVACTLATCCQNLWRVMQAPLATLQPQHAAARALAAKVGSSCAELREATKLQWANTGLATSDMATLGMLFSSGALRRVELVLLLNNGLRSEMLPALFGELGCGAAPCLETLIVYSNFVGNKGASALAAALTRGALPKLQSLQLSGAGLGDEGLAALAVPLRRRAALNELSLHDNRIGDMGVAALVDNLGVRELKKLNVLFLGSQIRDAGCASLAAALDQAALPLLRHCQINGSNAARETNVAGETASLAVRNALLANIARRRAAQDAERAARAAQEADGLADRLAAI